MEFFKKLLIIVLLIVISTTIGCSYNMQHIVRYDINKTELDFLYSDMPERDLFDVFGLPHITRNRGVVKNYYYYIEDIVLHITINTSSNGCWAEISTKEKIEEIDLPNNSKLDIDHNKYLLPINDNISESSLHFINSNTDSSLIQNEIGAPYEIREYSLPDGLVVNSFVYKLNNGSILRIIYFPTSIVCRAWIEDTEGKEIKVIVELQ